MWGRMWSYRLYKAKFINRARTYLNGYGRAHGVANDDVPGSFPSPLSFPSIPSHPISSHPIPSHPIPSHRQPSLPSPSLPSIPIPPFHPHPSPPSYHHIPKGKINNKKKKPTALTLITERAFTLMSSAPKYWRSQQSQTATVGPRRMFASFSPLLFPAECPGGVGLHRCRSSGRLLRDR